MLFNINELKWDPKLCDFFNIPMHCLPEVCSSAEVYGEIQQSKLGMLKNDSNCNSFVAAQLVVN